MGENIKTYVRVKPPADNSEIQIQGNNIIIGEKQMNFDKVFTDCSQKELFDSISGDILTSSIQGYNCTIFAYGQTGSGKTFTIQGKENNPGLVQRCLRFMHNLNMEIELSFVEIYNEILYDLLDLQNNNLIIKDNKQLEQINVENLTILKSNSYEESLKIYQLGIKTRKTKSTDMNLESSRSHSIFTVYIKNLSNNVVKESKLSFVDLAGSERLRNLELENVKIKETGNINKSLFCLGQIIYKLSEDSSKHIGYRDSKLTFLLKDSLGGNSKLRVIGNVCLDYKSDTINTLNFLCRLKMINNIAFTNSEFINDIPDLKNQLKILDQENQKLKTQVALYKSRSNFDKDVDDLTFYINKIKDEIKKVFENMKEFEEIKNKLSIYEFEVKKKTILKCEKIFEDLCKQRNEEFREAKKRRID